LSSGDSRRERYGEAMSGYALFDTAIGRCGVAWSDAGIIRTALPGSGARRYVAGGLTEQAPPPDVQTAIDRIVALLDGVDDDLGDIMLDLSATSDFERAVYAVARTIAPGHTLTYGDVAREIGGDARAVGQALGRNPCPIVVPCHRVVAAGGRTGGFSAPGGVDTKLRMLAIEREHIRDENALF